jgi:hypothetical protein
MIYEGTLKIGRWNNKAKYLDNYKIIDNQG